MVENADLMKNTEEPSIEQIVSEIQAGINVIENKEQLCSRLTWVVDWVVRSISVKSLRAASKFDLDDLRQAGYEGLLEAIKNYTPVQDSKFSNYAVYYVKRRIFLEIKFLKTSFSIPPSYALRVRKFNKAIEAIENSGNEPTAEVMYERFGITPEKYRKLSVARERLQTVSLNNLICTGEGDDLEYIEALPSNNDTESEAINHVYREVLRAALDKEISNLAPSQAECIRQIFFNNRKAIEVAEYSRISHQAIHVKKRMALDFLSASGALYYLLEGTPLLEQAKSQKEEALKRIHAKRKKMREQYQKRKARQNMTD